MTPYSVLFNSARYAYSIQAKYFKDFSQNSEKNVTEIEENLEYISPEY